MQDPCAAPPFKKLNWLKRDIEVLRRADGSMILRSRVPLQPYPTHIPSLLHQWAGERPAGGSGPKQGHQGRRGDSRANR